MISLFPIKNFRHSGIILLGIGIVLAVLGSILGLASQAPAIMDKKISREMCVSSIAALDFDTAAKNDAVFAQKKLRADPGILLQRAALAINACPGWKVSGFCVGDACAVKGIAITLIPKTDNE